jgi:hypothetical protein
MKRIWTPRIAALVLAVASAACGDSTGPAVTTPGGGLDFVASGAAPTEYHASGAPGVRTDGLPLAGSFAAAFPDSLGGVVIAGYDGSGGSGGSGDVFILQLTSPAPGEHSPCTLNGESGCHGRLYRGVDPANLSVSGGTFRVVSGRVVVTESTADRLRGSMDLTLQSTNDSETLTVTGGTFDLPVAADRLASNGVACLARNLESGSNAPC